MAETTSVTTDNGSVPSEDNGKRTYSRKPVLHFGPQELYALIAILEGDKNVNGAWNEHLIARIRPFLPSVPDLAQPPVKFAG